MDTSAAGAGLLAFRHFPVPPTRPFPPQQTLGVARSRMLRRFTVACLDRRRRATDDSASVNATDGEGGDRASGEPGSTDTDPEQQYDMERDVRAEPSPALCATPERPPTTLLGSALYSKLIRALRSASEAAQKLTHASRLKTFCGGKRCPALF